MINIITETNCIHIGNSLYPINSMNVIKISNGLRFQDIEDSSFFDLKTIDVLIDGAAPIDNDDFLDKIMQIVFVAGEPQPSNVSQLIARTNYNSSKYSIQDPSFEMVSFFESKTIFVKSSKIKVEFINSYIGLVDFEYADREALNQITVKSIAIKDDVIYPILYSGIQTKVFEPGDHFLSDQIIGLTVDLGEVIRFVHYIEVPSGGEIPANRSVANGSGEGFGDYPRDHDYTDGTQPGEIRGGAIFGTVGIYGVPDIENTPVFCIVGDSIGWGEGSNDPISSHWNRALDELGIPTLNVSIRGDQALSFNDATNKSAQRRKLMPANKFTHIICGEGTNDIQNGGDPGNDTIASLFTLQTFLKSLNAKVYQSTLLPKTNSTNNWVDSEGQSFMNRETQRLQVNTSIITTPAPLDGFIDVNVAGSDESGFWNVNGSEFYMTIDGIHPSDSGYQVLANYVKPILNNSL